jgi:hypothetical protein
MTTSPQDGSGGEPRFDAAFEYGGIHRRVDGHGPPALRHRMKNFATSLA